MENLIITRELRKDNNRENRIFNNQTSDDLKELYSIVQDEYDKEIAILFTSADFGNALFAIRTKDYEKTLKRCDKYIALKIIDEIQERFDNERFKKIEIIPEISLFESGGEKTGKDYRYRRIEDNLPSTDDVIRMIEEEHLNINRIHFLIDNIPSEILSDSLTKFLSKDLPFGTSIYVAQNEFLSETIPAKDEIRYISEEYLYITYNRNNDGIKNCPYIKKAQRKAKNEKV